MSDSFDYELKIQKTGVSKKEILDYLKSQKVDVNEADIDSVFTEFNSNKIGDSKDVLDMDEQAALFSFVKSKSGDDTNLTKAEFGDDKKFDLFEKFMRGYEGVRNKNTNDDKAINVASGEVTIGNDVKYKTDNSKKAVVTKTSKDSSKKDVTQKYKTPGDRPKVHLDNGWNGERVLAKKITENANGYKDVKNVDKSKTSAEVCKTLLKQYNLNLSDDNFNKLANDLVNYNPSMFDKDGNVYLNADWSKLDFPTAEFIKEHYSGETSETKASGDRTSEDSGEVNSTSLAKGKVQGQRLGAKLYNQLSGPSRASNTRVFLSEINEDNVVDVVSTFNQYSAKYEQENLLEFMAGESGLNGNDINSVITPLLKYAEKIGISSDNENYKDLKEYEDNYKDSRMKSTGYTKDVDKCVNALIKDINEQRAELENHASITSDDDVIADITSEKAVRQGNEISKQTSSATYAKIVDLDPNNVTHFVKNVGAGGLNAAVTPYKSDSLSVINNLLKCASKLGLQDVQEYKVVEEWQNILSSDNYLPQSKDNTLLATAIVDLNNLVQRQIGAGE